MSRFHGQLPPAPPAPVTPSFPGARPASLPEAPGPGPRRAADDGAARDSGGRHSVRVVQWCLPVPGRETAAARPGRQLAAGLHPWHGGKRCHRCQSGTAFNVLWGAGRGGWGDFNGTNSQIITAGPVLNTGPGASFTVAAWVYLTKYAVNVTAVSQDSNGDSAFCLQYYSGGTGWGFTRYAANSVTPSPSARNRPARPC